jgi:hypothetical protein
MFFLIVSISCVASLSLSLNIILIIRARRKPERPSSYEVADLLRDLLSGSALVKVSRISSDDCFFRSFKGR